MWSGEGCLHGEPSNTNVVGSRSSVLARSFSGALGCSLSSELLAVSAGISSRDEPIRPCRSPYMPEVFKTTR